MTVSASTLLQNCNVETDQCALDQYQGQYEGEYIING